MSTSQQDQILAKLCPHRGIGKENSLEAIRLGINSSPLFVEFDIQWHDDGLLLGHPPEIGNNTLREALELFRNTSILPKIDIKLTNRSSSLAIKALIDQLSSWNPQQVLINIAGDLNAGEYFQAETRLTANTDINVLLNIDLERYYGISNNDMGAHIKNLKRVPFSISPNLETNTMDAIDFAKQSNIRHIHFWSYFNKAYTVRDLYDRIKICEEHGLVVFFDIKTQNISDLRI